MVSNLLSWFLFAASIPSLASATIAITGPSGVNASINTSTGQRPFRKDINTFKSSGAAWDLYIQALIKLQAVPQTDLQSYYQVSGIHGYPQKAWDGVSGSGYQPGYCTHSSILFPTWHRPYLALYEQLLWKYANQIAATYTTNKATYQAAAKSFRMPYWDWAKTATLPDVVSAQTITITTPKGRETLSNPLYTYKFHPLPSSADFPRDSSGVYKYTQTVRCPSSKGISQTSVANKGLAANAQQLHDGTYLMLASQSSYGPFSNTDWPSGSNYQSVESLHNNIHGLVGGNGHMGYVPYSAFDPVFWLHHTNVDRIFAIWQALYPNSYVPAQVDEYGTYTNVPGRKEDANTHLTPFHSNTAGTLYTSYTARATRTFGYAYPEVVDWGVSATQLSANTRAAVNKLYNPNGTLGKKKTKAKSRRDDDALAPRQAAPDAVSADRQWALNFQGDKSKIPASLYLHFFIGTPASNDPLDWPGDHGFVATQSVLISPAMKEKTTKGATLRGQVQLTHALLDVEPSLEPKKVVAALKQKLEFRAATLAGQSVPAAALQGDETVYLELVSRDVRQTAPEDEFPVYGPWTTYAKGSFSGGTYSLGKSLQWSEPQA